MSQFFALNPTLVFVVVFFSAHKKKDQDSPAPSNGGFANIYTGTQFLILDLLHNIITV